VQDFVRQDGDLRFDSVG